MNFRYLTITGFLLALFLFSGLSGCAVFVGDGYHRHYYHPYYHRWHGSIKQRGAQMTAQISPDEATYAHQAVHEQVKR
jgi:hypothetical protein